MIQIQTGLRERRWTDEYKGFLKIPTSSALGEKEIV